MTAELGIALGWGLIATWASANWFFSRTLVREWREVAQAARKNEDFARKNVANAERLVEMDQNRRWQGPS